MSHNIKMPDGTIKAINGKLGSGLVDANNKEIFEGDKVIVTIAPDEDYEDVVVFDHGVFRLEDSYEILDSMPSVDIEIVANS